MKKTDKKFKFPSFRIKFSDFWKLTPQPYSCLSFRQVFGNYPKTSFLKNGKNPKSLGSIDCRQVSKFSEKLQKKFQVFGGENSLCYWVPGKFPSFRIHPPPLHGGYKIPSVYGMEVSIFRLPKFEHFSTTKFKRI